MSGKILVVGNALSGIASDKAVVNALDVPFVYFTNVEKRLR